MSKGEREIERERERDLLDLDLLDLDPLDRDFLDRDLRNMGPYVAQHGYI